MTVPLDSTVEATRSIVDEEPPPGTTTTVTITVSNPSEERVTLVETFSPAVADVTLLTDEAAFAAVRDDTDALVATYDGANELTLSYELAVPTIREDHTVSGTVDIVDGGKVAIGGDDSIAPTGLPPVAGENPPTDLDGDGRYEDINGDGEFDIFDMQALFDSLDSDAVQSYPEAFNFSGDDDPEAVTIFDVQALFLAL